jgi:DNA-directed RNA polymerase subunit alpha
MSSNSFLLNHPEVRSNLVKNSEQSYSLIVEPLYPGYGYTVGNTLRRILLSSIPGFGITKIKVNDLTHEYQAIEGVVEDVMQVILNVKGLRPRINTDEEKVTLRLSKTSAGPVYASDFNKSSNAEIVNSNEYICTLNKGASLEIEIEISRGVGYLSMDDVTLIDNKDARQILVDTLFSPVTNVALEVSKVRVGDKTNFDKLKLNFDIDGSVSAEEVVNLAFDILISLATQSKFSLANPTAPAKANTAPVAKPKPAPVQITAEEEIKLSDKITKILSKNEIRTNTELKARIDEVGDFTGIGAKALEEIDEYIKNLK